MQDSRNYTKRSLQTCRPLYGIGPAQVAEFLWNNFSNFFSNNRPMLLHVFHQLRSRENVGFFLFPNVLSKYPSVYLVSSLAVIFIQLCLALTTAIKAAPGSRWGGLWNLRKTNTVRASRRSYKTARPPLMRLQGLLPRCSSQACETWGSGSLG